MAKPNCCVCDAPIQGKVKTFGGRSFCERHYKLIARNRKGMWTATVVLIISLVLFVLLMSALAPTLGESLNQQGLTIVGVTLAFIPALLWLGIFYVQDRVEPEPKTYVLGIFFLGALLAQGVGQPLIQDVFEVNTWASQTWVLKLAAGILIVGTIQEFLKYAVVRYTVFLSQEFDELIDGIVYGAAAGLGYATMVNLAYILEGGGVALGIGATRIAVTALAHASFSGVNGYFLSRAKFEDMGPWWLPGGVLLSAILNGIVTVALGAISRTGIQATPLYGLLLAAVVAAATFALLFTIMRRAWQTGPAQA